MLIRNPANRLGASGFDDVRKHPWLKNVDWNKLLRKEIKSPYVPIVIVSLFRPYNRIMSNSVTKYQKTQYLITQKRMLYY